jgi:hypothetical protein
MNKHTPGPWRYSTGKTEALVVDRDGFTVMELRTTFNTTSHRDIEANARLIASAPELLSALSVLLKRASLFLDTSPTHDGLANVDAIVSARVAIEKATGGNNES